MSRRLQITLEPTLGHIHDFSAVVAGVPRISADGSRKRSWSGDIADSKVKVTVHTTGVPGSQFVLAVDLAGTANDFAVRYTLASTLHELEFEA